MQWYHLRFNLCSDRFNSFIQYLLLTLIKSIFFRDLYVLVHIKFLQCSLFAKVLCSVYMHAVHIVKFIKLLIFLRFYMLDAKKYRVLHDIQGFLIFFRKFYLTLCMFSVTGWVTVFIRKNQTFMPVCFLSYSVCSNITAELKIESNCIYTWICIIYCLNI